jgi:hypothetical protein
MLHTYRGSYDVMRNNDPAADEATITDFKQSARENADFSLNWYEVNEEANAVEMLPYQADNTAGTNGTWEIWGMARNGPAEMIAEISGTTGTAKISDDFTAVAYDTLTISSDVHLTTVAVADEGGANRPSKITFDVVGYQYLKNIYTDISSAQNCFIRAY